MSRISSLAGLLDYVQLWY